MYLTSSRRQAHWRLSRPLSSVASMLSINVAATSTSSSINLVFRSQCYFASTFYSTAYVYRIISFCFLSCILFYVACAFVICLTKYLLTYLSWHSTTITNLYKQIHSQFTKKIVCWLATSSSFNTDYIMPTNWQIYTVIAINTAIMWKKEN